MIAQETIDHLIGFHADGLPVVSAYVPVGPGRAGRRMISSYADSLARQARAAAVDDVADDRAARLSLRTDLDRLREAAAREHWPHGTVAVFACSGAGLFEELRLPRMIRERVVVDATPWVRPLLAVLDEYHRCCVVVATERSARLFELFQEELVERRRFDDAASPERHRRRLVLELGVLLGNGRYDVAVVGGPREAVGALVTILPAALRTRIAGTFAVESTATRDNVRRAAGAVLERYERDHERRLVAEATERAAAGGHAVVGVDDCLWAGAVAAIRTLLVDERANVSGVACPNGHWLASRGERCAFCARPTRRVADVLDELVETIVDQGGRIEHVAAETPLRQLLVAATLRFVLPPRPETPAERAP